VPTIREEYEKLGSYAMIGLPDHLYPTRFVLEARPRRPYKSSSPAEISAAAPPANTRRSHSARRGRGGDRGELRAHLSSATAWRPASSIPYDAPQRLSDIIKTGDVATLDFDADT
jgi:3-isopropylmalate/(R)-2-methylmalate dehydratase small subunit